MLPTGLISSYPHLQDIKLAADSFAANNKANDLVSGVDYYHDIVQGEVRKGGEGPVNGKYSLQQLGRFNMHQI